MKVTSKGQVAIPLEVRKRLGIRPAESEVEFVFDDQGRCYLKKTTRKTAVGSRFRRAYKVAKPLMSTEELMALTRGG